MTTLFLGLRATIFYIGYALLVIFFSTTGVIFFSLLPYKIRSNYIFLWNRCTVLWARIICGLKFEVIGKENLPQGQAYVALAKHQSQWETFFLQYFLAPAKIVLKKELLKMPVFGWGLKLTDPIAIDRGNPKKALKDIQQQGVASIESGISVLIFPEGTRMNPGTQGKYARGGANIAVGSGAAIVPIAHNAGVFWPADKFIKKPGTITVVIGKPIESEDKNSRELNELAQNWIEETVASLPMKP
jgi:1-acyl-sn-glycerol-3-phosphate acyltransferase